MIRRPKRWFYIAGCLVSSIGISLQHFGILPDFAAGALMGVAIGLLLMALPKPSICSTN